MVGKYLLVFLFQMVTRRLGCPTSPWSLRGSAANVTLPSRLLSSCKVLIGTGTRLMIGQAYIEKKNKKPLIYSAYLSDPIDECFARWKLETPSQSDGGHIPNQN